MPARARRIRQCLNAPGQIPLRQPLVLAPFFVLLALGLFVLRFKTLQAFYEFMLHIWSATEPQMTLALLGLIDLTITGSLIVIVISPATRTCLAHRCCGACRPRALVVRRNPPSLCRVELVLALADKLSEHQPAQSA